MPDPLYISRSRIEVRDGLHRHATLALQPAVAVSWTTEITEA